MSSCGIRTKWPSGRRTSFRKAVDFYGFSIFILVIEEVRKSPSPDFEDQDPESIGFIKVNWSKFLGLAIQYYPNSENILLYYIWNISFLRSLSKMCRIILNRLLGLIAMDRCGLGFFGRTCLVLTVWNSNDLTSELLILYSGYSKDDILHFIYIFPRDRFEHYF